MFQIGDKVVYQRPVEAIYWHGENWEKDSWQASDQELLKEYSPEHNDYTYAVKVLLRYTPIRPCLGICAGFTFVSTGTYIPGNKGIWGEDAVLPELKLHKRVKVWLVLPLGSRYRRPRMVLEEDLRLAGKEEQDA